MIKKLSTHYQVSEICDVLEVSRSSYYQWKKAPKSTLEQANDKLCKEIGAIFAQHRGRYGSPRITRQLKRQGHGCGENRVANLMRKEGLRVKRKKAFRPKTTIRAKDELIAPNRLSHLSSPPSMPNKVWVGDITYIRTAESWLYLAAFMDLATRKIVGWSLEDHMRTDLIDCALKKGLQNKQPLPGLIIHSDRGCQYTSHYWHQTLLKYSLEKSMSAAGYCYDNAFIESFWSSLKAEALPESQCFSTIKQARMALFEYIEIYYNKKRLHSSLEYQTPDEFETNLYMNN